MWVLFGDVLIIYKFKIIQRDVMAEQPLCYLTMKRKRADNPPLSCIVFEAAPTLENMNLDHDYRKKRRKFRLLDSVREGAKNGAMAIGKSTIVQNQIRKTPNILLKVIEMCDDDLENGLISKPSFIVSEVSLVSKAKSKSSTTPIPPPIVVLKGTPIISPKIRPLDTALNLAFQTLNTTHLIQIYTRTPTTQVPDKWNYKSTKNFGTILHAFMLAGEALAMRELVGVLGKQGEFDWGGKDGKGDNAVEFGRKLGGREELVQIVEAVGGVLMEEETTEWVYDVFEVEKKDEETVVKNSNESELLDAKVRIIQVAGTFSDDSQLVFDFELDENTVANIFDVDDDDSNDEEYYMNDYLDEESSGDEEEEESPFQHVR